MPEQRRNFVVTATRDYQPFPELWHGHLTLLKLAKNHPPGSHWKCMGSLLLLAFAIEGYANTAGEALFGESWRTGPNALDRKSWSDKLQAVGEMVGVHIDYGRQPWQTIRELFNARDRLAHPRPENVVAQARRFYCYEDELNDRIDKLTLQHWEKLIDVDELERVSNVVLAAMEQLHTARGLPAIDLRVHGGRVMLIQDVEPH